MKSDIQLMSEACELAGLCEEFHAIVDERDALVRDYNELIFAVANRYPEETRHETALRYILEAESRGCVEAMEATRKEIESTNHTAVAERMDSELTDWSLLGNKCIGYGAGKEIENSPGLNFTIKNGGSLSGPGPVSPSAKLHIYSEDEEETSNKKYVTEQQNVTEESER